ncbi:hypothetical protein PGTUg99_021184 [Puccinia graminis f. sp. tritici]|uniref:Uncharacterized protein n=1 Tax=Puccinia graminis f. sp. tritici TaxID=56615 RepID=A0A5B0QH15_PUCGR|nr:hypothetical protein PGTUg99_021184 [Puccinia graminis f. sp. tritici]
MDVESGDLSSEGEWVLQILPAMAIAGDDNICLPDQPTLSGDRPGWSANVVYNRTVLTKTHPNASNRPPSTFRRRTILWNEHLCVDLVMFFDVWFTRHQELVNKSSAFLVKATYFANFADVLRQYPRLDGFVQIMEMKGQYTHLCQVWKTLTEQIKVSAGDPMPDDLMYRVSTGGMSPLVYALLKDAIGKHRHIQTPFIIKDSPEDEISKSTEECASFLVEGLQAELTACECNSDVD